MAINNRFGWSISRESLFETCLRSYYFHYYLSWGGWYASSSSICREAFKLKRLMSLPLWRGQLVHYVATKVLASLRKKGTIPESGDVTDYIEKRFHSQMRFSSSRAYLTEPKKRGDHLNIDWLALFEHEYDRPIPDEKIEKTIEECREGIRGLLESPILQEIAKTDSRYWIIENIDLAEFAQVFDFDGARVFAKTDFIYRGLDGTFDIVDWKTFSTVGRSTNDHKARTGVQLGVYGYYASAVMREPLESIRLHEVNLLDGGHEILHRIDDDNIDIFRDHIRAGIKKLSEVLVDEDIQRNEAKGIDTFPKSVSSRCRFCNFYRICEEPGNSLRLE
ncbi:MAG: PD-(D/E)XK nuclease family protein [Bacteroidales bacterium]|nr:PD-(D/E)XK nuclease family protein [Candidatus Latescibacterota bacterium]